MKNQYENKSISIDEDIDEVLNELDSLVRSLGETVDGTYEGPQEASKTPSESFDVKNLDLGSNVEVHPINEGNEPARIFDSIRKRLVDLDVTSTKIELYLSELAAAVKN